MRLEPRPDLPQNGVAVAAEHDAHGVAVILQLQFILRFRPFAALVQPAAQKIFQPLVIFALLAFGKDRVCSNSCQNRTTFFSLGFFLKNLSSSAMPAPFYSLTTQPCGSGSLPD